MHSEKHWIAPNGVRGERFNRSVEMEGSIENRISAWCMGVLRCATVLSLTIISLLVFLPKEAFAAQEGCWPLTTDHNVTNGYSKSKPHYGYDFATPVGTKVYASFSGTVYKAEDLTTSYGKFVVVQSQVSGKTIYCIYAHMNQRNASKGESITAGQLIGYSGSTGNSTGPHLHFEVREGSYSGYPDNTVSPGNYISQSKSPTDGSTQSVSHSVDGSYPTPITAVPRSSSGNIQTYDANGNAESNRYISGGDQCTINAVYTDNWMQVTYPTSSSTRTAYVKKDVFFASNSIISSSWSPSSNTNSYKYADLTGSFGSVYSTDTCVVVGQSGSNHQVIYPIKSGYKLGWVSTAGSPTPTPLPGPINVPGPVAAGIFDGKSIVVMAPTKIDFGSNEYISQYDICILTNVNSSTGYCDVTYPSGGNDVFTSSRQKTKTVAMNNFVEYQPSFAMQKLTTDETYTVYPLSDMNQHSTNWSLDPGDEYYTVAKTGGTEVLYYCTRGKHQGYWKLGWADLPYYWLDLNGWLDGANSGDLGSYGAADVYVNGNRLVQNARDFYSANGTFPRGSTYEIKNIQASAGYTYNGVHSGSASGTLKGNTSVFLDFTKNPATLTSIRVKQNPTKLEYLEGESFNKSGLKVEAVYDDGSTSDVTSQCSVSGYDSTPGVKTVDVSYSGKKTAFTVVVQSKSPTNLAVSSSPTKTEYQVDEEISLSGLQVTSTYDNGTSAVVDDYEVMIDEGITSSAGKKTITISYVYNNVEVETSFEITVSEQDPDDPPVQTDGLTLSVVASDQVAPGDTFDVKLNLTNNEGIASLKVKVNFDSSLLELTKITYNSGMGGMSQQPQKKTPPVTLNWFNGSENFEGDATYATLTFKAVASSGSKAKIELSCNPNDVYDITETNVPLNVVDKTISIGDATPDPPADGWVDLPNGKKGYRKDGKLVKGWLDLDGSKYYFDSDGAMVTGWLTLGDSKYWFHEDGPMATGWTDVVVDGKTMHYYFNPASGNLARGTWMEIDGKKYYFRPSGNAARGWATIRDNGVDKKYWFDDDFQMVTGWRDIVNDNGVTNHYYFRPAGSMATGWATIDGEKYWFRASGNMATGFASVDDAYKRYFDGQGHMLTGWQVINGKTYYFRSSGAMQTGEKVIDGKTYVFSDNGVLVSVSTTKAASNGMPQPTEK